MTTEQQNHFKELLLKEKNELALELKSIGTVDPEIKEWSAVPEILGETADPNDRADRDEDFGERHSTGETLEQRFMDISSALERIEQKTYGLCRVCNKPISIERLTANPAAATCTEHMNQ